MVAADFLRNVSDAVAKYQEETEGWKRDHEEALKCMEFEQLIAFGLSAFELLKRIDQIWKRRVEEQTVDYDEAVDEAIERLYNAWLQPCAGVLARTSAFEKAGFKVVGSREFRSACAEARYTSGVSARLRIGKAQLDRGEMIPFSDTLARAKAKRTG
jgi:hypothetical protein